MTQSWLILGALKSPTRLHLDTVINTQNGCSNFHRMAAVECHSTSGLDSKGSNSKRQNPRAKY